MIFLADECVQDPVVQMLRAYENAQKKRPEHDIRQVKIEFGAGSPDDVWMAGAAEWKPKPMILSGDSRILSRSAPKRKLLRECGFVWFGLADGWENLDFQVLSWKAVKVWPEIVKSATRARPPKVFRVHARKEEVEDITSSYY